MSKAFTKESDGGDGDEPGEGEEADGALIPKGSKNYVTPGGFAQLRKELHTLLNEERPELVRVVSWAASNGDRSENADYIYGKRRLREIDRRIRFLSRRLDAAEVVDPEGQAKGAGGARILFGATVTVADEDGARKTFAIVGVDEIDPARGRVSWLSPVARALLNAKVGDVVTLRTPRGEQELEVLTIEYRAL